MVYQNLNMYSREGVKKPKVIVQSVKSDTIYTPLWINGFCNNIELKKSIFSRYYLNDARLNSLFSLTEKELQDTTEIVMKFVNSLYGDSIAQQLGLTTDKILKYQSTINNNTINLEEALKKWNIKDYMAMGNLYPYNCVFNVMENTRHLSSTDRKVATSEFGNFSQNTFLMTNTSSSINTMGTVDKIGHYHHLNLTKINKEIQTTDKIPLKNESNCRGEPLVSLEVTTFANGKLAKINCSNKTNESSVPKTKLFLAFTEYKKLLNVLQRMAAVRTDNISLQKSTDIENKCNALNTNYNRNINYTNNAAQVSYKRNVENLFTCTNMTKTLDLICEKKSGSMLRNQKYCMTTYTSTEPKANAFRRNLTNIHRGNQSEEKCKLSGNSVLGHSQRYSKSSANLSNQKSRKSQVNAYRKSNENLRQNKLLNKRVAPHPFQNSCKPNCFVECKDFNMLNMCKEINSKVQSRKKVAESKKQKTLESQKNKFQSGFVQKKKILNTQSRNVQVMPLAPITTTTAKKSSQKTNKKKNCKDSKKSDMKGIFWDEPLENTMDVIDWIEKNSDTLNTVQFNKSVNEIKEDLLRGVSKNEEENKNESENKSLSEKSGTEKKKKINKENFQIGEKTNPRIKKENYERKILKENVIQFNDNTAQLFQKSDNGKSTFEKDQIEIPSTKADKNKNETDHENKNEYLINETRKTINDNETFSTEKNSCINSNKSNPISDHTKIIPRSEDGTEYQKNNVPAEGTVLLPNSNEDNNQKAYPYNLRKRKPVVYYYPSVFRRIVPNRECKKTKKRENN